MRARVIKAWRWKNHCSFYHQGGVGEVRNACTCAADAVAMLSSGVALSLGCSGIIVICVSRVQTRREVTL